MIGVLPRFVRAHVRLAIWIGLAAAAIGCNGASSTDEKEQAIRRAESAIGGSGYGGGSGSDAMPPDDAMPAQDAMPPQDGAGDAGPPQDGALDAGPQDGALDAGPQDGGANGDGGVNGDGGSDGDGGVNGDGGSDGDGGVNGDGGSDGDGGVDGGGGDGDGGVDDGGTDGGDAMDAAPDADPDGSIDFNDAMPDAGPPPDGQPDNCTYETVDDPYGDTDGNGNYFMTEDCYITWGPGPDDGATINEPCIDDPDWRRDQCNLTRMAHLDGPGVECTGDNSDGDCGLDSPGKQPVTDEDMPPADEIAAVQWLEEGDIEGPYGYEESEEYEEGTFADYEYGCPADETCEYDVGGPGYYEDGEGLGGGGGGQMPGFASCPASTAEGTGCDLANGSTSDGTTDGECDFDDTCSDFFGEPADPQLPDPATDDAYKAAVAQNQQKGATPNAYSVAVFGDSVLAKHNQPRSGRSCTAPNTTADWRNLIGNDFPESPVGRGPAFGYTRALPLARTGWQSDSAYQRTPPPDACGNANTWPARNTWSPVEVAQVWAQQEPAKAKRIVVADGGINDKDWTASLAHVAGCNLMRSVVELYNRPDRWSTGVAQLVITVNGRNPESDLLEKGGTCRIAVRRKWWAWPVGPVGTLMAYASITVPGFSYTPAQLATITGHVTAMRGKVAPWAGKLIWLRYYDINPSEIDLRGGLPELAAAYIADFGWVRGAAGYIPGRFVANRIQTVLRSQVKYVDTLKNQLNGAIWAGLGCPGAYAGAALTTNNPTDCSGGAKTVLFTGVPATWDVTMIQRTVIGGMPHPQSATGSIKLGETIKAALDF